MANEASLPIHRAARPLFLDQAESIGRVAAYRAWMRVRKDQNHSSRTLKIMLRHLEGHLFDPEFTVRAWRKDCGIRDHSVTVAFREQLGACPKAYLMDRRLETGAFLLQESVLATWSIATLVGFKSVAAFSQAFSRWSGLRPERYRAASWTVCPINKRQILNLGTLHRAVIGALPEPHVRVLVRHLLELYPGARQAARLG